MDSGNLPSKQGVLGCHRPHYRLLPLSNNLHSADYWAGFATETIAKSITGRVRSLPFAKVGVTYRPENLIFDEKLHYLADRMTSAE